MVIRLMGFNTSNLKQYTFCRCIGSLIFLSPITFSILSTTFTNKIARKESCGFNYGDERQKEATDTMVTKKQYNKGHFPALIQFGNPYAYLRRS